MKSYSITSEPAAEPLTLAEVKNFLKIDSTDEDTYLTGLIQAARQAVEKYLGRALITQAINFKLDDINSRIPLWWAPVQSIERVKIYNKANAATTITNANYSLIDDCLIFNDDYVLDAEERTYYPLEISYVAGYGDSAEDVPAGIKQGLLEQIGSAYSCGEMQISSKAKMFLNGFIYRAEWVS